MKTICMVLMVTLSAYARAFAPVNEYVSVNGKKLMCNGQPFYAISMNYVIDIVHEYSTGNEYIAPSRYYGAASDNFESGNETGCFNDVVADLQLLKGLGFNSIRLLFTKFYPGSEDSMKYMTRQNAPCGKLDFWKMLPPYSNVFGFVEKALLAAKMADLKVVFVLNDRSRDLRVGNPAYLNFLALLAAHFKDNATLMGYDFFNEPEYGDNANANVNTKSVVCEAVRQWSAVIHANAPFHLTTIGYNGPKETERWDPAVLDVDFASFHPYHKSLREGDNVQKAINRIKSEIYWFGQTMQIPWMIGETSISVHADINYTSDQGTPEDQRNYAAQTMAAVRDCGGCGYMWWEMYDVMDATPNSECETEDPIEHYRGIMTNASVLKPVAYEFALFNPWAVGSCTMPPNYYNSNGFTDHCLYGILKDQNGNRIPHAVVTGSSSSSNGNDYVQTYTDGYGLYALYSRNPIYSIKFMVPAGKSFKIQNTIDGPLPIITLERFSPAPNREVTNVTFPVPWAGAIEAVDYINATNVVIAGNGTTGSNMTMEAGNVIRLKNGFIAEKGCAFRAWIGPINPECDATNGYRISQEPQEQTQENNTAAADAFVRVFPSPTNGTLTVQKSSDSLACVEVRNTIGQPVLSTTFTGNTTTLELTGQAAGMYFVYVMVGDRTEIIRIVKQ